MRYLYRKVLNAAEIDSDEGEGGFLKNTEPRKLFAAHLKDVVAALKAIEWNDSADGACDEDKLIMNCFKFLHQKTMNNEPRLMIAQPGTPEAVSVLPPMGWVKLPSGESFAIADIAMLGEIKEGYDNDCDCEMLSFRVVFANKAYVDCVLHDIEASPVSLVAIRLERFREQIAIARWGENCIEMKGEDKSGD